MCLPLPVADEELEPVAMVMVVVTERVSGEGGGGGKASRDSR